MQNVLPDIMVVVQVALEGAISKRAASSSLSRGEMPQVGVGVMGGGECGEVGWTGSDGWVGVINLSPVPPCPHPSSSG